METHKLKCHPEFFKQLGQEDKNFEIRKDDRGFKTGDHVLLEEFKPGEGHTGRMRHAQITHVMSLAHVPEFGSVFAVTLCAHPWVVLGLKFIED